MTDPMWFAWLLRADVRQGAAIANQAAQRDFVTWWLLDGPSACPGGWSADAAALGVAMEPAPVRPGFVLPRLLRGLYRRRADLRDAFPLHDLENLYELLAWYRLHGAAELHVAPALPDSFLAHTEAPAARPPWAEQGTAVPRMAVRLHAERTALQQRFDPTTEAGRHGLAAWYAKSGSRELARATPAPAAPRRKARGAAISGEGVNLVGYPRGEFGLGEDIRMLARALDAAGIEYSVFDLAHGSGARQQDASLDARISEHRPYDVDILCQNAFDTARWFLRAGPAARRRHTIGYWPWELQRFPSCWRSAYGLVDEVWAASRFTFDAYAADQAVPVHLMPPAVVVDAAVAQRRRDATEPFTFLCPFDPNSFFTRKNPLACVRAFRVAFAPDDDTVRLVLKVNGALDGREECRGVLAATEADPRCVLEQGTMSRLDYQQRIAQADCLVSPHRAEGFGRNIAEAILLGVAVLATGASGCTDFLEPDEQVAFAPRLVCPGEYPFGTGMFWAEPDVAALADAMRRVRGGARPDAARRARMWARCDPAVVGRRVAERLGAIFRT